jgi:hypothetical protein
VAPQRKRSVGDYEQALRRQELAAGRALVQALPAEGSPRGRELAAARRVLTQALFELRRLGRDLDQEIEGLRARQGPARQSRSAPGELDRFEAVRNAVEEVAERWEGRRDQLSAELDRRQPRRSGSGTGRPGTGGGRPGSGAGRSGSGAGRAQPGQGRQPRQPQPRARREDTADRGDGVRRTGGAAPARPERPRSRRSRRSPG